MFIIKTADVVAKNYSKLLEDLQSEKKILPQGSLIIRRDRYSHYLKGKEYGITRQAEKIMQLARSKYVDVLIEVIADYLDTPLKDIDKFQFPTHTEIVASLPAAIQKIPDSYFYQTSLESWLNQPTNTNPRYREKCIYPTKAGFLVRSKEEVLISNVLTDNGIPHKYEEAYELGGHIIYPDFTIKNPYTGQQSIWEHNGAFHIEKYGETAHKKIVSYAKNGLILNDTLIITYADDIKMPGRIQEIVDTAILKI